MSGVEVGIASVIIILILIYAGIHVAVALGLVSFIGVWISRDSIDIAISLLAAATHDTIAHAVFANIPLFALMGIVSAEIGLGADIYKVAHQFFQGIRGGLGMATVAANAMFASITGSSIASASVFTRIAVPEMRRFGYTRQFSVGVVAGRSVLGMLIPPASMLQYMRGGELTEIEEINCAIVREAALHGVPAPVNYMLCKLVRAARCQ